MNITSITVNSDQSLTVVSDGNTLNYTTSPVVAPTDTEVDLILSDGSIKKFVPAS